MEESVPLGRLTVEERLASAPEPPRTGFGLHLKSRINFLAGFVKTKKPKDGESSELHAIRSNPKPLRQRQDLEVATGFHTNTDVQANVEELTAQPSPPQHVGSPATHPIAIPAPLDETINNCQTQPSTAEDSLQTTKTHDTSLTSIDVESSFTRVQGYWVSSRMPEKELQKLWIHKIQTRLTVELLASVRTGGWVLEFCLIGKTQDDLKPCIVVTCVEKGTKKEVERIYKSFLWLREIMKTHHIRLITFHATTRLSARFSSPMPSLARSYTPDASGPSTSFNPFHIPISGNPPTYAGNMLTWPVSAGHPSCIVGGLIVVDGIAWGLSAGHAFPHNDLAYSASYPRATTLAPSSLRYSLSTDSLSSPGIFDENEDSPYGSPPSSPSVGEASDLVEAVPTVLSSSMYDAEGFDPPQARIWHSSISLSPPLDAYSGEQSVEALSQYWDWAIVALGPDQPVFANRSANGTYIDEVVDIPDGVRVVSVLQEGARGLEGLLHPLPVTLNIGPYMHGVAYRISMKVRLAPGFSGAWVVLDGKVCGIIVAVREDVPWVYVQPMKAILQDIEQKMNAQSVGILPRDHPPVAKNATMVTAGTYSGNAHADADGKAVGGPSFAPAEDRLQSSPETVAQEKSRGFLEPSELVDVRPLAIPQTQRKTGSLMGNFPRPNEPQSALQRSGKQKVNEDDIESLPSRPETRTAEPNLERGLQLWAPQLQTRRAQPSQQHTHVSPTRFSPIKIILHPMYQFEMFVLRHEFRRKKWLKDFPDEEIIHDPYDDTMSAKLFRLHHYSVAGTLDDIIKFSYGRDGTMSKRKYYQIWALLWPTPLFLFALVYYVFCLPFHWWIANKHRDLLDTRKERRERRKTAHLMLGSYSTWVEYEYDLEDLGLDEKELNAARATRRRAGGRDEEEQESYKMVRQV